MSEPVDSLAQTFGARVRERRLELGWSQERLAEESGLDRTYVSGIERAARNPTLAIQDRIAQAMQTTVAALLKESEA